MRASFYKAPAIAVATLIGLSQAVYADYTLSLTGPDFPKGITVKNATGDLPMSGDYKNGWTADGWIPCRVGTRGYVAVSPTSTGIDSPCENRLSLPLQHIEYGMFLKWESRSMLSHLLESYRVEVSEPSGETVVIAEIDGDAPRWSTHMSDLSRFAGKDITISFVCTSVSRYMLALSEISLFTPDTISVVADNSTRGFFSAEGGLVEGTILNTGITLKTGSIVLRNSDGEEIARNRIEGEWATGITRPYRFNMGGELNTRSAYSIWIEDADVTATKVTEGSYYTSWFSRNLLVDKATGMWCVNCPAANLALLNLEDRFPGQVVAVETHVTDPLENKPYWDSLDFHSVPRFLLDRIPATQGSGVSEFSNYFDRPTRFEISLADVIKSDNGTLQVEALVRCAETIDNTSDRFRIGYVVTADYSGVDISSEWYQANNSSMPTGEQYYFLPSKIPPRLLDFRNVSVTSSSAFGGLENSLAGVLAPYTGMNYSLNVELSESDADIDECRVVLFVLDSETGVVENVTSFDVSDAIAGGLMPGFVDNKGVSITLTILKDGMCRIATGDRPYILDILNSSGICFNRIEGNRDGIVSLPCGKGIYMLRLISGDNTLTKKINFNY